MVTIVINRRINLIAQPYYFVEMQKQLDFLYLYMKNYNIVRLLLQFIAMH